MTTSSKTIQPRSFIMKLGFTTTRSTLLMASAAITMLFQTASAANKQPRTTAAHQRHPFVLKDMPDTGEQWSTLANGIEFQPAANLSPLAQEHLRRLTSSSSTPADKEAYVNGVYAVDGLETYYDEWAQAWRTLGFYIDCDASSEDDNMDNQGDCDEESDPNCNCKRYLLWAAYIDEGYSGHQVGEYQYYDRHGDKWSDYACKEYGNNKRCVKMDCHLPNTHFSLLGFFKEAKYEEWMEQLFKHEGDCLWTDEEYQFMRSEREAWPRYCTASDAVDSQGRPIYFDLKPEAYGSYDIGLYIDASCVTPYTEGNHNTSEVLMEYVCNGGGNGGGGGGGNNGNGNFYSNYCSTGDYNAEYQFDDAYVDNSNNYQNGGHPEDIRRNLYQLEEELAQWNDAFDVFKQCSPCKSSILTNMIAGIGYTANADGTRYDSRAEVNENEQFDDDQYEYYGEFRCHDAAGANSVNQCMKFKTKTRMQTASWQDVIVAGSQGTITQLQIPTKNGATGGTVTIGQSTRKQAASSTAGVAFSWLFLIAALVLFAGSLYRLYSIKKVSDSTREPLIINSGAHRGGVSA